VLKSLNFFWYHWKEKSAFILELWSSKTEEPITHLSYLKILLIVLYIKNLVINFSVFQYNSIKIWVVACGSVGSLM